VTNRGKNMARHILSKGLKGKSGYIIIKVLQHPRKRENPQKESFSRKIARIVCTYPFMGDTLI